MPSYRRAPLVALVALAACAGAAAAQSSAPVLSITVLLPIGSTAAGAKVEIAPDGAGAPHVLTITEAAPTVALALSPGAYRLRVELAEFRAVDQVETLSSGVERHLTVHLAPEAGTGRTTVTVDRQNETSYQTSLGPIQLRDLPGAGTVWSLLETAHPFVISDRIDNGGLWSARPALLAGEGLPWNQTQYRLGSLDVTDTRAGSQPAIYPDLGVFDAVQVEAARMSADIAGPGPAITLIPRRPGDIWTGSGETLVTPGSWQPNPVPGVAPAIARFDSWTDVGLSVGGPVVRHTGLFASIRGTRAGRLERADPLVLSNDVASLYGHLVGTAGPDRELRITTALSRQTRPFAGRARFADRDVEETGRTVLGQASVEQIRNGRLFSVSGGFQRVSNEPQVTQAMPGGAIERLTEGYPLAYADDGHTISQRWTLAASFAPTVRTLGGGDHQLRIGGSIGHAGATNTAISLPAFGELVDGRPTRVWELRYRGAESQWAATTAGVYVEDRIAASPRVTVDAGLRFDYDSGSAKGAGGGIRWGTVLPRFNARWTPWGGGSFAVTTGYGWSRNRLPLSYLAVGDPAGVSGTVYRWDDRNGDKQFTPPELTAVAQVGTCCTGDVLNTIDPDLKAPYTTEFFIGAEHRFGAWRGRLVGMDRRGHNLAALVDTGVAAADYQISYVADTGIDVAGSSGTFQLPIYNRAAASFGRDRYRLTNPSTQQATYQGVEITADRDFHNRWFFRFGGSAYRTEAIGTSRGFFSSENDQGALGEAFLNPNALTAASGRTYFDRAYVIKLSGSYHAPGDVRIGVVARYQDGQPFSRVVLADGLTQGREAIMAIPRGAQRFTYTFTLDTKIEKDITLGRRQVGLIFEAFNLFDTTLEVEEHVVTGVNFRAISAVQPPRAIRVGTRIGF